MSRRLGLAAQEGWEGWEGLGAGWKLGREAKLLRSWQTVSG